MSNMLQEIKTFIGIANTEYDFLIILVILIMIILLFNNMLGIFKTIFDIVGGKR